MSSAPPTQGPLAGKRVCVASAASPFAQAVTDALTDLGASVGGAPADAEALVSIPSCTSAGIPLDDVIDVVAEAEASTGAKATIFVSRVEVVSGADRVVPERSVTQPAWPRERPGSPVTWSPPAELAWCRETLDGIDRELSHRFERSRLTELAREGLLERKEPGSGSALEGELAHLRLEERRRRSTAAASSRAALYGFRSARAWALAIAEQTLVEAVPSTTVVRLPTPLLPSAHPPLADWASRLDEALPVAAPLDAAVDLAPASLCVAGVTLAVEAAVLGLSLPQVVHVAATEKLSVERLTELYALHRRRAGRPPAARELERPRPGAASGSLSRRLRSRAAPWLRRAAEAVKDAASHELGISMTDASSRLRTGEREPAVTPADLPLLDPRTRVRARALVGLAQKRGAEGRFAPGAIEWRRVLLDDWFPALDAHRADAAAIGRAPRRAYDTLPQVLVESAERYGARPALSRFQRGATGEEEIVDVTYRELLDRSLAVAHRLALAGVEPGDRVAVAGDNHPDWCIVALGALCGGAALVPLDPALTPEQAKHVLAKARPAAVVVDKKAREAFGEALPASALDLHLTATAGPRGAGRPRPVDGSDVASVLFTSGTTGDPKGVVLSHRNFTSLLASLAQVFDTTGEERGLSVLPLHHTLEFTCGLLLPLSAGARVFYVDELTGERVLYALREGRVTGMVGVPAVWQLLERRIRSQADEQGELAKAAFDLGLRANQALSKHLHVDVGPLLFRRVHRELGGHLKVLISGGAALPSQTHALFQGLGLPLAEGYGLTETAPVLTVAEAIPGAPSGTVGRPVPGVEIKIGPPDEQGVGEVLARGPNVMAGYFENREATVAAFDEDGWLKTGDLGRFDHHGNLVIAGRAKDVVVSASGENIYLDDVEDRVGSIPGVAEWCLLGLADPRGGERLCAAGCGGAAAGDESESSEDIEAKLEAAFRSLPPGLRPAVVAAVPAPLPRTATQKVKRRAVVGLVEQRLAERAATRTNEDAPVPMSSAIRGAVHGAIALVAGCTPQELQGGTTLPGDLGFDSLMWVELKAALEPLVSGIDAEALAACRTVAEVEGLVAAGGGARASSAEAHEVGDEPDRLHLPAVVVGPARSALTMAQRDLYRTIFDTEVVGRSHIPLNEPAIVVANHSSHLDTGLVKFALGPYGRRLRPLAAKDYFFEGNRLKVAFFEQLTNLVALDRESASGAAFDQAVSLVEQGEVILIYPEGTRRIEGTVGDFKPLVGRLSLKTGAPVLPVHLDGAFQALPKGASVPRQRRLRATIGPPVRCEDLARLTRERSPVEAARDATALIRACVVGLRDGAPVDLAHVDDRAAARLLGRDDPPDPKAARA